MSQPKVALDDPAAGLDDESPGGGVAADDFDVDALRGSMFDDGVLVASSARSRASYLLRNSRARRRAATDPTALRVTPFAMPIPALSLTRTERRAPGHLRRHRRERARAPRRPPGNPPPPSHRKHAPRQIPSRACLES